MSTQLFEVKKGFHAGEDFLEPGEVVIGDGWTKKEKLISLRFLVPFYGEDKACPFCDRYFSSENILDKHIKKIHPEKNNSYQKEPVEETA